MGNCLADRPSALCAKEKVLLQDLATSLVYYLPSLDLVLLRSLRMLCQSSLVSASLTSRIVSVLSAKLSAECRQPVLLDLLMDILERREDPLLPGDIPLCLDLAREMAELNSGATTKTQLKCSDGNLKQRRLYQLQCIYLLEQALAQDQANPCWLSFSTLQLPTWLPSSN